MATGVLGPPPLLLWSASNMLKFRINEYYLGHHYTWCSPAFEGAALPRGALGHSPGASSDPATIYRRLHNDVRTRDKHSNEIQRQRDSLKTAALMHRGTAITVDMAHEIGEIVDNADIQDFEPVLYAIPYTPVQARVERVKPASGASITPEYLIADLKSSEFQMIMPMPCP